jgi:hypothetical protein
MAVPCRNATRLRSSSVKVGAPLAHAPKKNSVLSLDFNKGILLLEMHGTNMKKKPIASLLNW